MFVSNIGLYSSGVASSIAPMKPKPALLTRTSSLPKASIANATAFSGRAGLGHIERSGSRRLRVRLGHIREGGGVARRGDDLIAAIERRLGEQAAEAGGTAGNKPSLGHDFSRVGGSWEGNGKIFGGLLEQARESRRRLDA